MMGDLCSEDWIDGFGRWSYGSNHHHTMPGVVAVQGANVVFQTASGVLDGLTREARNVSDIL